MPRNAGRGARPLLTSSPVLACRTTGALVVGAALALSACSGGSGGGASSGSASTTEARRASTTTTTEAETEPAPGGPGGICTKLGLAADQLANVPIFLHLDSPQNVVAVREQQLGAVDLDVFFRAMVTLHQLDGSPSPLGDPRHGIDVYERAAVDAKGLFAAPVPDQAAINAYQDSLGDPATFLGHQTSIAAALTEAGC